LGSQPLHNSENDTTTLHNSEFDKAKLAQLLAQRDEIIQALANAKDQPTPHHIDYMPSNVTVRRNIMTTANSHSDTITTPSNTYYNSAFYGPTPQEHTYTSRDIRYPTHHTHTALANNQVPAQTVSSPNQQTSSFVNSTQHAYTPTPQINNQPFTVYCDPPTVNQPNAHHVPNRPLPGLPEPNHHTQQLIDHHSPHSMNQLSTNIYPQPTPVTGDNNSSVDSAHIFQTPMQTNSTHMSNRHTPAPELRPESPKRVHFQESSIPNLQSPRQTYCDSTPTIYSNNGEQLRSNLPWSSTPNAFVRPVNSTPGKKFVKWSLKFDQHKSNLHNYLQHFETHANLNTYTESDKCQQLLQGLGHDASRIIPRLGSSYSYKTLKETMYAYFEPAEARAARKLQFQNAKREPKQTPRDFANKLDDLAHLSYESMSQTEREKLVITQFIHGQAQNLVPFLLSCQFHTIDQAVNHVDMIENIPGATTPATTTSTMRSNARPIQAVAAVALAPSGAQSNDSHAFDVDGIMDVLLSSTSPDDFEDEDDFCIALASQVYRRYPQAANQKEKCFYCGMNGHRWLKCYRLRSKLQQNGFKGPIRSPPSNRTRPVGQMSSRPDTTARFGQPTNRARGRGRAGFRGRGRSRGNSSNSFRKALVNMLNSCDIDVSDDDFEDADEEEQEETKN
jgi:hypothetical protein